MAGKFSFSSVPASPSPVTIVTIHSLSHHSMFPHQGLSDRPHGPPLCSAAADLMTSCSEGTLHCSVTADPSISIFVGTPGLGAGLPESCSATVGHPDLLGPLLCPANLLTEGPLLCLADLLTEGPLLCSDPTGHPGYCLVISGRLPTGLQTTCSFVTGLLDFV
ncbi:hypothetical protein CRENBAI_012531 [Crenichthys baileyi]|uniref:Uncharacterized protein n=1 Tax=Crenichthys baileyi TaxID=28760 RepID=A0AAV9RFK1_9TELE